MMRQITSFYYLNYPDDLPQDPLNAYSEIYVEVGGPDATTNNFDKTFSFHVFTVRYLKDFVENNGQIHIARAAIIVHRFDDESIKAALQAILDNMEEYGIEK